jgi:SAM-dependent methyltransferase
VQYRDLARTERFVWDPATLLRYDPVAIRRDLTLSPREPDELETLRRTLSDLVATLAVERSALEAELQISRDQGGRLSQEVAMLHDRLASADRELQTQRTEAARQVRAHQVAVNRANAFAQRVAGDATRAEARVRALLSSKSWRITRPLRAIHEMVHRPAMSVDANPHSAAGVDIGSVNWGDLARRFPFSDRWGFDRGQPIDRFYIHRFLETHRADVRGRVLEVKDTGYATAIGGPAVTRADALDIVAENPRATIIADLASADELGGGQFDCFILTQTLHIIYDCRAALRHAARLLAPGGVLLCTIPAVSRVSDEDGDLERGDYWRMTRAAVRRLFEEAFQREEVHIETYGNVLTCAGFLYGLAAEELSTDDLEFQDPWFPLIHCVRAAKNA